MGLWGSAAPTPSAHVGIDTMRLNRSNFHAQMFSISHFTQSLDYLSSTHFISCLWWDPPPPIYMIAVVKPWLDWFDPSLVLLSRSLQSTPGKSLIVVLQRNVPTYQHAYNCSAPSRHFYSYELPVAVEALPLNRWRARVCKCVTSRHCGT